MATYKDNPRFCKVYPHVLAVEGGYVNDPHDKGGATKYGIAFNYNQGYLKTFGILHPEQMRDLTKEQALEIYFRKYWLPSQADEIPDGKLALMYFDHVVNAGQGSADKLLQKLDQRFWYIKGDGANVGYFWEMTARYLIERLAFYMGLQQWSRYGLGWTNRLRKLLPAVSKMDG